MLEIRKLWKVMSGGKLVGDKDRPRRTMGLDHWTERDKVEEKNRKEMALQDGSPGENAQP